MPAKGYVDVGVIGVKINEMPTWQWIGETFKLYTQFSLQAIIYS